MRETTISKVENGNIFIHGYELLELMEDCSFGDLVMLMATGKMPSLNQGKLMETLLVSCCDQGHIPPSTNAARYIASCGAPLQVAVATGLCILSENHGDAVEACARLLQQQIASNDNKDPDILAAEIVETVAVRDAIIPGLGQPVTNADPRAEKLLEIACQRIKPRRHIDLLLAIQKHLVTKKYPRSGISINGAVAAVISDLEIDWQMGKGIFIISRSLGLIAHALEGMKLDRPFDQTFVMAPEYIGPNEREVPLRLEPS